MERSNTSNKLRALMKKGRRYKIARDHILQSSDTRQAVNLIETGYVKRYMIANDGSIGVQSIYGPDDFFPLTIVFKALFNQDIYQGPEVYHYQTITDTEFYTIDRVVLETGVQKDPLLYRDLLVQAGKRFHSNIQQLENLSLKSSYLRVSHQLLYFAKKFGVKQATGVRIDLPLSHQDIADVLSITRETVTNSIKILRDKGLIKTGKYILVPNLKKLEKEAYK